MKFLLLISLLIILSGCSTIKYNLSNKCGKVQILHQQLITNLKDDLIFYYCADMQLKAVGDSQIVKYNEILYFEKVRRLTNIGNEKEHCASVNWDFINQLQDWIRLNCKTDESDTSNFMNYLDYIEIEKRIVNRIESSK